MRAGWLGLIVSLAAHAAGTLPAAGEPTVITLPPRATQEFALPAAAGFFDLDVDPRGARLVVTAGTLRADLADGPARQVSLCWVSESADASAAVVIESLEESATRALSVRLTITPAPVSAADASRARGCALLAAALPQRDLASKARTLAQAKQAFLEAGDWRRVAEVSTPLGQTLWELGKTAESIASHEQAVAAWERAGQPGRKAGAMAILAIGYGLLPDKRSKAIPTTQAAATLARESGDGVAEAMALVNLVDWQTRDGRGESGDGREWAMRAIALNRAAGYRAGEAIAWNSLAAWQTNQSATEAESSHREALRLRRELHDEAGEAQSLSNLAIVYSALGNQAQAVETLEHALAIRKRVAPPANVANTQHNLAVEYVSAGEFDRGIALFEEALRVWRALNHKLGLAATLTELALVEMSIGKLDRAERLYQEALAVNRELGNRRAESNALRSLGAVRQQRRAYAAAAEMHQRAARLAQDGRFLKEESRARTGLGLTYASLGRFDEALQELRQAKETARPVSLPDLLLAQIALANVLRDAGQTAASLREFEEAAELTERPGAGNRGRLSISAGKTLSQLAAGDVAGALAESGKALQMVEELRANLASGAARAEQLDRRHEIFHAAASARMRAGDIAAAFEASERGHARSLVDLLAGAANPRERNDSSEERRLRATLSAKAALLSRLLSEAPQSAQTAALRAEVATLEEQYTALNNRLAREHPEWARAAQPAALAHIQQRLGDGEAVLEFLLGADRSYAWVVSRAGVAGVELPRRSEIEAAVAAVREQMKPGEAAATPAPPAFAQLRQRLFQGAAAPAQLRRFRKLYVVPDGELHFAPFAALLAAAPRSELAVVPSASVLAHLPRARATKPGVLVFADPVYESIDARLRATTTTRAAAEQAHRFPRLRFSAQEAESIRRLAGATPVMGLAASRTAFNQTPLHRYGVLHFATHAVTFPKQPELSAIVLSLQDKDGQPVDGFVRLYDITRLRLPAPLVVLSACDTAVGRRLEGEGPLGISRAFLAAGAAGVVATLWAVDDAATAELMAEFYRGLFRQRLTPAAALRQAQRAVQAQARWAHPYYWAGFVYTGR